MKFTINGFSQEKLIEHGLDAQDALLLDWLSDLISSPKIKTVQHEGFIYYWIKYDAVLEDLPILTIKNTKGIGKKFLELETKGLLVKRIVRDINGSFSYFRFTDAVHDMKRAESNTKRHCPEKSSATEQEKRHCPEKSSAHCPQKGSPLPPKGQSYNPPTIDPPTKDISNDISTRDKKTTNTKTSYTKTKDDYTDDFLNAFALYPKRAGSNSKLKAWKQWQARLKEGHTVEEMTAGIVRYQAFIHATGKEQTEFVKMTATFLGRDKHFLEDYLLPKQNNPETRHEIKRRENAEKFNAMCGITGRPDYSGELSFFDDERYFSQAMAGQLQYAGGS